MSAEEVELGGKEGKSSSTHLKLLDRMVLRRLEEGFDDLKSFSI